MKQFKMFKYIIIKFNILYNDYCIIDGLSFEYTATTKIYMIRRTCWSQEKGSDLLSFEISPVYCRNILPHPTSSLSLAQVIASFACFDPVKPSRVKCYDSLSLAR